MEEQSNDLPAFHAHRYRTSAILMQPLALPFGYQPWLLVKDKAHNSTQHSELVARELVL